MASVSLKNVTKIYSGKSGREVAAVEGLNLDIQDREFVVLAGPPNSGLSSIVRMIAGLEEISKGDIFIGDRRVNDLSPKDHDITLVSRDHAPYPRMSVYENLALGLKLRKFPTAEIKKRVAAASEVFGLQEMWERKPGELSDEQCQRIALARAIALQPKVFLFDEPLTNLDAKMRGQLRGEIAKLHQRLHATIIYATHDPVEALALGGRMVVVHGGAIQQDGTGSAVYDEPANVFVAGFVGNPPMNLVGGTLKQDRDGLVFTEANDGTIEVRLAFSELPAGQDFGGKTVLLGVRPEEIKVAESSQAEGGTGSFPAIIDVVEVIGSEANLSLQTGAHTLICRTARGAEQLQGGRRARFQLNLNRLCIFDPVSGRRLG